MNWSDFLEIIRVRAAEEADGENRVWDGETRRAVTREAGEKKGKDAEAFLSRRSSLLISKTNEGAQVPEAWTLAVPSWVTFAGWILAFVIGWWFAALGQEQEINLLALPLIGLLAWNAVVTVLSLLSGTGKIESPQKAGWLEKALTKLKTGDAKETFEPNFEGTFAKRSRELTQPALLKRLSLRFREWLHIGAAILALGSVAGMYARGWSKEYRAVWESTLLDNASAQTFFRVLFTPASAVTGIAIPLEELPAMRRGADHVTAQPGPALPWIHLYAATLGLFIVVPRILLTALDHSRTRKIPHLVLQNSDWQAYTRRLLSQIDGQGASALVLIHGLPSNSAAQDRWRQWTHSQWNDVGRIEFQSVPVGAESEFVSGWQVSHPRAILIFNMATTPELEVHRALVETLLAKIEKSANAMTLFVALDDFELRKRWSGFADSEKRLAGRAATWHEKLASLPVEWLQPTI